MVLNIHSNVCHRIRALDFKQYHRATDPTYTTSAVFKTFTPHSTPTTVTNFTPAPLNPTQARKYPDAAAWSAAHDAELDQLDDKKAIAWLTDASRIPKTSRPLPLKMTYRYKRDGTGSITKRKARCTLRGDKMRPHFHYDPDKTTSYMDDKTAVRLLFAIAATYKLPLEHLDIEGAYLHERFKHSRPVYVKQLARFNGALKHRGEFGQLIGNLYGGKNAGFLYLEGAFKFLRSLGFKQSKSELCLFSRTSSAGSIFLAVSMDDFAVTASNTSLIDAFVNELATKYTTKRLGTPTRYLGWTVVRNADSSLHISQPDYIEQLLAKLRMQDANGKPSPYPDSTALHAPTPSDQPYASQTKLFQQAVGYLRYIADCTRPDIHLVTNKLSCAMKTPTKRHWSILKRVARYLRATQSTGIHFPSRPDSSLASFAISSKQAHAHTGPLKTYSDADHAGDANDCKSISGIVHLFNGAPISWSSAKQTINALSTCEAEYIAATAAVQQTQWLRRLLADINMLPPRPRHST